MTLDELMERNVILHCLSTEMKLAYLVQFSDGDDPYNVRKYPLLVVSQKCYSRYVYIVQLDDFIKYCDTLDVASRRIIWMSHSVRCGSTLWGQIFNSLPDWGVVSESMFAVHTLLHERSFGDLATYGASAEFGELVMAGFKFHISRFTNGQSVLFKVALLDHYVLPHIYRYFTDITVFHAYRNVLPSARSWYNSIIAKEEKALPVDYAYNRILNPNSRNEYLVSEIFALYTQRLATSIEAVNVLRPKGLFEWYIFLWCSKNSTVRISERNGIEVKCLRYECLLENKEKYIRKLFQYLDIYNEWVSTAVKATDQDSQSGIFLSHSERQANMKWKRTEEAVKRANQILSGLGYPGVDSDFKFENTL